MKETSYYPYLSNHLNAIRKRLKPKDEAREFTHIARVNSYSWSAVSANEDV